MNIYYRTPENNIFMRLRSDDRWYLIADQDFDRTAHLYININGEEYPLMSSRELCSVYPELNHDRVLEYYNAVIYEAFLMLKAGNDYIDFYEIEADTLPCFLSSEDVL